MAHCWESWQTGSSGGRIDGLGRRRCGIGCVVLSRCRVYYVLTTDLLNSGFIYIVMLNDTYTCRVVVERQTGQTYSVPKNDSPGPPRCQNWAGTHSASELSTAGATDNSRSCGASFGARRKVRTSHGFVVVVVALRFSLLSFLNCSGRGFHLRRANFFMHPAEYASGESASRNSARNSSIA